MPKDKARSYRWTTSISKSLDEGVQVRGYDVLNDLVGTIDFGQMVYLLFKGELPLGNQGKMINAIFVCVADHGISPSATVTRFVQSAGVPIQCAVAAGIMTLGDIHGGAGEAFCRTVKELVEKANGENREFSAVATEYVRAHKIIDGFGHPQHPEGDPRKTVLFRLADEYGISGDHVRMTDELEHALQIRVGRRIPANVDAAIGAIAADLGFDWRLVRSLIAIPRTAGLFAHSFEEMTRERGWRELDPQLLDYDGLDLRSAKSSKAD
jgi:citrate synthase